MKKIILLLALILVPNVFATIEKITNTVDIKLDSNNTLKLSGEGLAYERDLSYTCTGNSSCSLDEFSSSVDYSFYQNLSCQINSDIDIMKIKLDNISKTVTEISEEGQDYYLLYTNCHAEKGILQEYKDENSDYFAQLTTCENDAGTASNKLIKCEGDKKLVEETYETMKEERDDAQSSKSLFIFGTIAGLLLSGYLWFFKVKGMGGRDGGHQDDDPRDMEGLN